MLSRAASCKLSHTRVVRRHVFEELGGGWRKKDRKTNLWKRRSTKDRFLTEWDTHQPLLFSSPPLAPLKKKNPRQKTKTISRTVLRHRDRPLRSFHLECQPEMCMAREPGPPITFRNRPRTHKALRAFVDRLFLDSFPRTYLPESCSNTFCRLLHLF